MQVRGEVKYNGYGFDECVVGRTAAYVDQNDNHIAELTVRETLVGFNCLSATTLAISLSLPVVIQKWLLRAPKRKYMSALSLHTNGGVSQ